VASRKEQKQALRQERQDRAQAEAAAAKRRRTFGYVAAGVLVAAAVVALLVVALSGGGGGGESKGDKFGDDGSLPKQRITELNAAVKASGCKAESFKAEGSSHVEGTVKYEANPPHSGDHFAVPAEDGAYTDSVRTEQLVHTLEHGRILLQYSESASQETRDSLKALFDENPYHMVLAPNATKMPYEVAAVAWTKTLGCKQMNDRVFDAMRAFRDRHRDHGPEFVN